MLTVTLKQGQREGADLKTSTVHPAVSLRFSPLGPNSLMQNYTESTYNPISFTTNAGACSFPANNLLFIQSNHNTSKYPLQPIKILKSRKENPQKLTQFSPRSHPRHLVGKRTAQKDTIIDTPATASLQSIHISLKFRLPSFALEFFFYFRTNFCHIQ